MVLAATRTAVAQTYGAIIFPPGSSAGEQYAAKVDIVPRCHSGGLMCAERLGGRDARTPSTLGSFDKEIVNAHKEVAVGALLRNTALVVGRDAAVALVEPNAARRGPHCDYADSGVQIVGHEQMLAMRQTQMQQQMQMQIQMQMQMQMQSQNQMQAFSYARRGGGALGEPLMIPLEETSVRASGPGLRADASAFQPGITGLATTVGESEKCKNGTGDGEALRGNEGCWEPGFFASRSHVPRQARTLSTSLQVLCREDPDCLFVVRRINKLGFKACHFLKRHFAAQGTVIRVLAAHSTVRQNGDAQGPGRRRPSSLGFVQMASAQAVQKILALGTEHTVDGCIIVVQKFERQDDSELLEDEASSETSHGGMDSESCKGHRFLSEATASTASGSSLRERQISSESGESDA